MRERFDEAPHYRDLAFFADVPPSNGDCRELYVEVLKHASVEAAWSEADTALTLSTRRIRPSGSTEISGESTRTHRWHTIAQSSPNHSEN